MHPCRPPKSAFQVRFATMAARAGSSAVRSKREGLGTTCRVAPAVILSWWLAACTQAGLPRDTLYQVSLVNALLEGDYDGRVTLGELLEHGSFGLGTFDRLDGEMIVLNGTVYKATSEGTVERPPPEETTPFATVTRFRTDSQVSIDHRMTIEDLEKAIDDSLDNPNIFYALRVETRIAEVTVRSVDAQEKPYRDLVSIARDQTVWTHVDIRGTLVGIRSPPYVGSMTVPGYHWHFISADREFGGHVLAAVVDRGVVDIDHIRTWEIALPPGEEFGELDLAADRSSDLEIVEK